MVNELKRLWKDRCTIQKAQKITQSNRATGFDWVDLCVDEPCKLSFFNNVKLNSTTTEGLGASAVIQQTKLFIRADLDIPAGCRIKVITHGNKALHYRNSGVPAVFTNHQEIMLEVDDTWA